MLCLSEYGFVPYTGSRHLYGKDEFRAQFGPCNEADAFLWIERGGAEYHAYVSELYKRVYQKPLWNCTALPWHFTRGLLGEEDGLNVEWAQYAISLRRRGKRNRAPTLIKKYRDIRCPLPFKNPRTKPTLIQSSSDYSDANPTYNDNEEPLSTCC
ncbi:hypothetical protein KC19_VG154300 [Ceratodon purpureus]|uniref:Uncharacterized protein n=1 Tax=Ceratodon purpureus TaxID=3225 RepID=A0A8T0HQC8_CERPU|nr:hypothetical protein KC19_VG154300 [Ceratodon purpureus]